MGRIGKSLQTITDEQTRVQRETGRLVRMCAAVGMSLIPVLMRWPLVLLPVHIGRSADQL